MPALPSLEEETICEINRDFFNRKEQDGDGAKVHERYSKILGRVFPKLHFKVRSTEEGAAKDEEDVAPPPPSLLQKLESLLVKGIFSTSGQIPGKIASRAISWHKHRLFLAFASNGEVLVVDFEESEVRQPYVLTHDMQQDVGALEWRPNSGSTLAVGCRGGVSIWISSSRTSITTTTLASSSPGTSRWTQVDFLRFDGAANHQVTALSWNPSGSLLACGSLDNATFTVWDMSLGECSPLRRGIAGVHSLKWSPTGDYLISAMVDSSFYLWETVNWTSEPWSSSGGTITNAAWSPDGRMLLCAFDKSCTLGSLHFAGKPPSLEVHLLPLELPEMEKIAGHDGHVEMMAWDGTGERLAISYSSRGDDYAGLVAIYDTRRTPITSASLLGFIRGPGGQDARPLSLAFHDKLRQGALLAICWSTGVLCVYPLLFRTH